MNLVKKPKGNNMYVLGDDGLKKIVFQFLDDDFAIMFHDSEVKITKKMDKSFYDHFSELFDNSYIFRDTLSYQQENKICWVSDEYLNVGDNNYEMLTMTRDADSINFSYKNSGKRGLNVIRFSPMGSGRYSRNAFTGSSFQDDIIEKFNIVLRENVKNKGRKK